jgi:carbon monoxide dehydrogenase subunit G
MRLRADLSVGRPAADVWAAISSRAGVACLPAVDLERGTFSVALESGTLVLEGSADVVSDPRVRTVTVDARGTSGGGRARATMMIRVREDGLFSTVDIEAELSLSGELAGRDRLVAEALYRLGDEWAACLEGRLGARASVEPARRTAVPEAETAGWLSRLLGRFRGR